MRPAIPAQYEPMKMNFDLMRGIEVLERTPDALRALLSGLSDEWTMSNEGPDTFSAWDNVGHLVNAEYTNWIPRARVILDQADRRFPPFDRFAHYAKSRGKSLADLLDEFAAVRARNIDTLRGWNLTDRELSLTGEHPQFGSVSLRQLLATWVVHDLGHTAQIARVMAKQYREAVGPWQAFLPILTR